MAFGGYFCYLGAVVSLDTSFPRLKLIRSRLDLTAKPSSWAEQVNPAASEKENTLTGAMFSTNGGGLLSRDRDPERLLHFGVDID